MDEVGHYERLRPLLAGPNPFSESHPTKGSSLCKSAFHITRWSFRPECYRQGDTKRTLRRRGRNSGYLVEGEKLNWSALADTYD